MILPAIAVTLAGVTAGSVGLAVVERIPVPHLAGMFATAGVALDVFKYLAWPKAAELLDEGRRVLAGGMVASALALAGVSGWATYDRVAGAMTLPPAAESLTPQVAQVEQRLSSIAEDRRRVAQQADAMRSRGMVTPARDFEVPATERLDRREEQALTELQRLRQEAAKSPARAPTPDWLVPAVGLGFALALELVPVLIFLSAGRSRREPEEVAVPTPEPTLEPLYDAAPVHIPVEPETPKLSPKPVPEPALAADISADLPEPNGQTPEPTFTQMREPVPAAPGDADLLQNLLDSLAGVEPGTSMPIKKFARAVGIGNTKAGAVFQAAEELGALTKTNRGYVVAERSA